MRTLLMMSVSAAFLLVGAAACSSDYNDGRTGSTYGSSGASAPEAGPQYTDPNQGNYVKQHPGAR